MSACLTEIVILSDYPFWWTELKVKLLFLSFNQEYRLGSQDG